MKQKNGKPILPNQLCLVHANREFACRGKYHHRGCCQCWELNHGDRDTRYVCYGTDL